MLLFFSIQTLDAQQEFSKDNIQPTLFGVPRKPVVATALVLHSAYTFYIEYQWWWKGEYKPFAIQSEGFLNDYSLGIDKFGHFYTPYAIFSGVYQIMTWGGFDESTVLWTSISIPAFHALTVEIGDGFTRYQFAPDDLLFNALGISYGVLQLHYPVLQNFVFKWSYFPTTHLEKKFNLTNDYDGHIYWLALNVHNLLPKDYKNLWPKYLNLAVGYGAKNASVGSSEPIVRKFAIGLDYNLLSLPITGETWDVAKNIFDKFHYPAPGIRFIENQPAEAKLFLLN